MRILLVEDETGLCDALAHLLRKNMHTVDTAYDGDRGLDLALSDIYDAVVLDWMLPGRDGLSILRELRAQNILTPVLLLTARDAVTDRVAGLDAGADDYLIKPFSTEELLARLRALSRRNVELFEPDTCTRGDLALEAGLGELKGPSSAVRLTQKECLLMEILMRNCGKPFSKERLFDRVWGIDSDSDLNSVEIYIHHLRKKLQGVGSQCSIDTVRSIGYIFKEG